MDSDCGCVEFAWTAFRLRDFYIVVFVMRADCGKVNLGSAPVSLAIRLDAALRAASSHVLDGDDPYVLRSRVAVLTGLANKHHP